MHKSVDIQKPYIRTEQDFIVKQYAKKTATTFFKKLGNSLIAVVVVLPFAGLLAAVGGIVMSLGKSEASYTTGLVLADMGQTVISNLGLLFMFAILLGFTNTRGYALFSAIVGYIAFVGFITPFIRYVGGTNNDPTKFSIWFWHNLDVKTQLSNVFGLGQDALKMNAGQIGVHGEFARLSYRGFTTLNTGVLGGICLGFVYTYIFNKGKDLKLPNMLSFFSGEKFSTVVSLLVTPIVASIFIIVWPGVNYVLGEIGVGLTYLPYGIDAGVFGIVKQLLIPFEAHQAVIAPLWYTSAGGVLNQDQYQIMTAMMHRIVTGSSAGIGQEASYFNNVLLKWANGIVGQNHVTLSSWLQTQFVGNNFTQEQITKVINNFQSQFGNNEVLKPYMNTITDSLKNYMGIDWTVSGDQLMTLALLNNSPFFDMRDAWSANLKITRFITGGYANLMFLTPTVGIAMWSTLSKNARKRKMGFYLGAALPSFLLGVNEPIIFMFAYTAPIIYYVAYSGVCGILFLFTSLFQAKLGSTFSQGLVDFIVNGLVPTFARGGTGTSQTNFWVPLAIGVIIVGFAFFLFRYLFIKLEFAAPGSVNEEESLDKGSSPYSRTKPLLDDFLAYFDGKENLQQISYSNQQVIVKTKKMFEVKKNDFFKRFINNVNVNQSDETIIDLKDSNNDILKAIDYASVLISTKNKYHKHLSKEQRRIEKINKINANWKIKQDKLDTTSEIEQLTYNYKMNLWILESKKQRQINKINKIKNAPLSSEQKMNIKDLTKNYKNDLKIKKSLIKKEFKANKKK